MVPVKFLRGLALVAFTLLVWGLTFVNTRALLPDFSALEIQVVRFTLGYVALWCIHPRWTPVARGDERLFIGMGLSGVAVYQLLENCAIHYTNASNVAILVALCPMATALLAWLLGRSARPTWRFFVGFVVAIIGVALVCTNGVQAFHFHPLGDLIAFCAMLSWGGYSIFVDVVNTKNYPPAFVIRRTFFWALVFTVPIVLFGLTASGRTVLQGSFAVSLDPAVNGARFASGLNLLNLGFLGLLASAACFVVWNMACEALGTVRCTVALYLTPVVTVLFAAAFLGERMTIVSVLGSALILGGVILSGWQPRPQSMGTGPTKPL